MAEKNTSIFFHILRGGVKIYKFTFPDLRFWVEKVDKMIKSILMKLVSSPILAACLHSVLQSRASLVSVELLLNLKKKLATENRKQTHSCVYRVFIELQKKMKTLFFPSEFFPPGLWEGGLSWMKIWKPIKSFISRKMVGDGQPIWMISRFHWVSYFDPYGICHKSWTLCGNFSQWRWFSPPYMSLWLW